MIVAVMPVIVKPQLGKRFFDLLLVLVGMPFWGLLLMVVLVIVRLRLGSPVFFCQQRPGLRGKPFLLVKFRTMRNAVDASGEVLPDAKRMTPFGMWLRSTSLDELPELWNVLRGDMSLVGPRPLLMDYLTLYSERQSRRHSVMPGITGWVQVNGRNELSWDEKFEMDLWYVESWSLILDCRILLMTAWSVISRHGITARGEVTMPVFEGNNPPEKGFVHGTPESRE